MKKIGKFLKGLCIGVIVLSVIIFSIYSMAWFALTKQIESQIDHSLRQKKFSITGASPRFTGYPSVPQTVFSGTFEHKSGLQVITPELRYTGFPTVGQVQTFDAPQGLKMRATFLDRDLNFDYAYLQLRLPNSIPLSQRQQDVQNWQTSNSPIIIRQILLKSGNIYARGAGTLSLDEDLQISADINARVVGMDIFFDELEKEQGKKAIAIARSFFNVISQVDEKTGEKYFETTLKIQKQGIFFGPMRVSGLPKLIWE